jgi:hypothetical protein
VYLTTSSGNVPPEIAISEFLPFFSRLPLKSPPKIVSFAYHSPEL